MTVPHRVRGALVTVRADATLLASDGRGGWFGRSSAGRIPAAGVMLDAALGGFLDLEGRRGVFGDHRRVVPGPRTGMTTPDPATARLVKRLTSTEPASPAKWVEHAHTWAVDSVLEELVAAGAARGVQRSDRRSGAPPGLCELNAEQVRAATERVRAIYVDGLPPSTTAIATAALLDATWVINAVIPHGHWWAARKHLRAHAADLPPLARTVIACLRVDHARSWRPTR